MTSFAIRMAAASLAAIAVAGEDFAIFDDGAGVEAAAGDGRMELRARIGLCETLAREGDLAAAGLSAQEALPLARRLSDQESELTALLQLSRAHREAGENGEVVRCLAAALPGALRAPSRPARAEGVSRLLEPARPDERVAGRGALRRLARRQRRPATPLVRTSSFLN